MEKYEIYKLIHFAGIFTLMFAFGSLFTGKESTKGAAIGHGIALLLILLGGFGMWSSGPGGGLKSREIYQMIYGTSFPTFLILKVVIWIAFGGAMVLAKRRVIKGIAAWVIIIALGLASAYLGMSKPALGNKPAAAASE